MLREHLFIPTRHNVAADVGSKNAELLIRGGFIRPLMAGVTQLLPLGLRVQQKISQIVREEMNHIGGQELLLTALQPKELWDKTSRWEELGRDVMYQFYDRSGRPVGVGLAMTHEEPMVQLVAEKPIPKKDLPFALYQIQTKFRDEPRAKAGLLRGREFVMKDLYSFHTSEADLNEYYEKVKAAYVRIFAKLDLPAVPTLASGGVFSTLYSHEFQTITPAGEDTIYVCPNGHEAINDEIVADIGKECLECKTELTPEKAIEVGNIFKIGKKYSEPLRLKFVDDEGRQETVIMGCYGLGISRTMGAIVETHYDDAGIIWPATVAPFQVHVLNLSKETDAPILWELIEKLEAADIELLVDNRPDVSAGAKLTEADLLGLPFRIVISQKTGDKVEVKPRAWAKAELLPIAEAVQKINDSLPAEREI